MKKILQILFIISLIFILLFVMYSRYIKKDKIVNVFGYSFLIVLTGSMEPEIEMGSFIIIKKCNNYNIGDIVTYLEDDYFITHRIVEKDKEKLITKGDNNNEKDIEITNNKISGKVVFSSIIIGNFIRIYLKYIFIIFTLFIIFINIYWNFKERNNINNEKIEDKKME